MTPFTLPVGLECMIPSDRPADELAGLFGRAAAEGRVSGRVDGSPYIVRLGGTVEDGAVDLEARLLRADGSAGRPKRPLRLTGHVHDRPAGSTLELRIAPDDRGTLAWVAAIPAIAFVLMLAARLPVLAIILGAVLAVPNVLLAIRAGQRFSVRYVSQVEAFLELIARGG